MFTSLATRLVLLFSTSISPITFSQATGLFFIGFIYDLSVALFIILPFLLQIWFTNNFIYKKSVLPVVCIFFIGLICLVLFTNIVPRDFNLQLYKALVGYIFFRFAIYLLLYFMPVRFRFRWRQSVLYLGFTLVIFLVLFNAVSEWFFWQEFSTRYNFIAVDYLIYTKEVVGNIKESYPIVWIITILILLSFWIVYLCRKSVINSVRQPLFIIKRTAIAICLLIFAMISYFEVQEKWRHFSNNEYANSLAGNGLYEFGAAFNQNELDFYKFYKTLPDSTAFSILRQQLQLPNTRYTGNDSLSIKRKVFYEAPERKLNVVLISVESLSADFMHAFGNTKNITPYLDSLAARSLFFTNLYASGTRTVRGLEALTLSIPPTPGESVIKRPDNSNMFSLGSIFRSRGYITQFMYGGYSYFDNMKTFFGNNNYSVIDRSAIPPGEVHYQNIWGVADEDLFTLALKTLDNNANNHRPFFTHIMTVSNHRPYTYPEGRIDIPSSAHSRDGAVKYTDYAINKFLKEASGKKWFDSTIFVIVADHCAGSAGNVELPVTGYHIPLLIYAPAIIAPKQVQTLTAQIDIAPTILGLLRFNYTSKFFGQDVLNLPEEKQRAFISTYQGLGFLKDGKLIIQSPVKNIHEFIPDFISGNAKSIGLDSDIVNQAISYYQCASWLLKHKNQLR